MGMMRRPAKAATSRGGEFSPLQLHDAATLRISYCAPV